MAGVAVMFFCCDRCWPPQHQGDVGFGAVLLVAYETPMLVKLRIWISIRKSHCLRAEGVENANGSLVGGRFFSGRGGRQTPRSELAFAAGADRVFAICDSEFVSSFPVTDRRASQRPCRPRRLSSALR